MFMTLVWIFLLIAAGWLAGRNLKDEAELLGAAAAWSRAGGKFCGLIAALLVLNQLLLAGRLKTLDRWFSLNKLLIAHRYAGPAAALLASAHPLLLSNSPIHKFDLADPLAWPLWLGLAGLIMIWVNAAAAWFRPVLKISYKFWRTAHQSSYIILALALIHPFLVGSDLQAGPARWAWLGLIVLTLGAALRVKYIRPRKLAQIPFTVTEVRDLGGRVTRIELEQPKGFIFSHRAGQFAFFRPIEADVPLEEHPFTITAPAGTGRASFTAKAIGDFTETLSRVKVGDKFQVDGPYGKFSHQLVAGDDLLFICGGIGVTPAMSIIRDMATNGPARDARLIWSAGRPEDLVFKDELDGMNVDWLQVDYILTKTPDWPGPTGRLDEKMLNELLEKTPRGAAVFICGPPGFVRGLPPILKRFGFREILTERFAL